ncbi:MAG TPA: PilZ domain-containing protein [Anaeromyxobacteraceae bacterium]|nr:PilZ domain-containing protein [Anaeromyxobacteraceae bacterium]
MGDRDDTAGGAPEAGRDSGADRRDSHRVPIALQVRDLGTGGSFESRDGNLALGGVYYEALHPPVGGRVELRFLLPGAGEEIRALGEVLRVSSEGGRFGAHVKFAEIPLEAELAIARFLQS